MDKDGFEEYLKKGGRSPSVTTRCIRFVTQFEEYLQESKHGKQLSEIQDEDLMDFVFFLDQESEIKAKGYLWALTYYYDYISNGEIRDLARRLRAQRIQKLPFSLRDFRGVNPEYIQKLAEIGIRNVNQMLEAGRTDREREFLSQRTGIPEENILELVKLSDLA